MTDLTLTLFQVQNTIINAAIISNIPLNRWKFSLVIMIQKEPNDPMINKLRVINKLESDYNLVLKLHWPHQATHYTEKMNHPGEI